MTRLLSAANLAQLESDSPTVIYFLELEIDSAASPEVWVRLHTGLGSITFDSRTFTGAGSLLSIGSVGESNKMQPRPLRCTLSGVDSTVTNLMFNQNYYQRPCRLYLGTLTNGSLNGDPDLLWSGFIQQLEMTLAGQDGDAVELTAESEFILFKRSRNVRYTDRQLQSEYSGDVGFEFLESVSQNKVVWRGRQNRMGSAGASGINARAASAVASAIR